MFHFKTRFFCLVELSDLILLSKSYTYIGELLSICAAAPQLHRAFAVNVKQRLLFL